MAWYENATIFYDWIRYAEDLDEAYARHLIRKTLDCHCDTLAFCVHVGGYALWDSTVSPTYKRLGGMDLIGELARLCGEQGLRFVPWWLATVTGGVRRWVEEHPDWQLVGPPVEGRKQARHNYVCYNSPYRDILYGEVREVLAGYEVDGIYFDQLPGSCYCSHCRRAFREAYGEEMPIVEDEFFVYNTAAGLPDKLREFRDACVRDFMAGIRRIVDETRPGACYAQNWVRNQQAYLARDYADVLLPEFYQKEDLVPLGLKHRLTKAYFGGGPIWGNVRHSTKHDARHNPIRGTRMLLVDCVANLASPLMLDLCAMDFDPTGTEALAETFDHIRAMQRDGVGASEVRYAALLHSRRSHELHRERFEAAFEGLYRLLFENHVPFDIATEDGIQDGCLSELQVLVLPDAMCLADRTGAAIREAVGAGMGLVGTFGTGMYDHEGQKREQPLLADLFGVEVEALVPYDTSRQGELHPVLKLRQYDSPVYYYGSARPGHELTDGIPTTARFAFLGGFVDCRPSSGTEVVADVHAPDRARLDARIFNRCGVYPAEARWPLALARDTGAARAVYIAAQGEAENRRAHAPELDSLMVASVLWAGGTPPLETIDCPHTVEVRLFHDAERRRFQVILVNQTTNPLVRVANNGVVRYVTPQKGLRIALNTDLAVKQVRSVVGTDVQCHADDGQVILDIPVLDLYDSILVECV